MTWLPRFAFLLLLVSVSSQAEVEKYGGFIPKFGCFGGPFSLRLTNDYEALRSLGTLRSERVLDVRDWDTYKTETRELVFDGLRIEVITFTNDKSKAMLETVEITSRHWDIAREVQVGDSIDAVTRGFGVKEWKSDGEITFNGETDYVKFSTKQGRIIKIRFECYTG